MKDVISLVLLLIAISFLHALKIKRAISNTTVSAKHPTERKTDTGGSVFAVQVLQPIPDN
jgi:hypothetical protein